jgi:hypothetical protein
MVTEGLWGWHHLTVYSRSFVLEWMRIPGGIGRVISEKSPTLGEITDTGVIRYRWKAAHLRGGASLATYMPTRWA